MATQSNQPNQSNQSNQPAPRTGPIRIVLVDDHRMFRTGVRSELA